jgi:hypothetical protein
MEDAGQTKLYETRGGAHFLVRDVKDGMYAEPDDIGGPSYILDAGLYPLTRKQALAWAENQEFDDSGQPRKRMGQFGKPGKRVTASRRPSPASPCPTQSSR